MVEDTLIGRGHGCERKRRRGDCARGHVAAKDFDAIEVDDSSIIAEQSQSEGVNRGGAGQGEGVAEVGSDVFTAGGRAVTDHGGFVSIAVTELSETTPPRAVVE